MAESPLSPTFVERDEELQRLNACLEAALAGEGQICFVTGEAGAGKSALLNEFTRRAQADHPELIYALGLCNAQTGAGESFQPFREVLELLTGDLETHMGKGQVSEENAQRIQKFLAFSGLFVMEVAIELIGTLIPAAKLLTVLVTSTRRAAGLEKRLEALRSRKAGGTEAANLTVDRERMFEQCLDFLCRIAAEQPLLVMFDDLQWADASSISLLFHIARRLAGNRVLVVGAFRPEEIGTTVAGHRHPLDKTYAELQRYYGDIAISLSSDPSKAQTFVNALVDIEPNYLDAAFRRTLCIHTGGNPLFTIELLQTLRERGTLVKDSRGGWVVAGSIDWSELPRRVDAVLAERLSRLEPTEREMLRSASVEGEFFTAEVLANLQKTEPRALVRQLSGELLRQQQLFDAVGVERVGRNRLSTYRFTSHLLHSYLYGALDEVERSYLHEDVGLALEEIYAGHLDTVVVQLAWHFSEAGLSDKAVFYLRRAGEMAAASFAHDEALQNYSLALDLIDPSVVVERCELLLAREALYNWRGEREKQAADLAELAKLAGQRGEAVFSAEVALRRAEHARLTGRYADALGFVEQAASWATSAGDPALIAQSHYLRGRVLYRQSRYPEAQAAFEESLALSRIQENRLLEAQSLYDLGLIDFAQSRSAQAESRFGEAAPLFVELSHVRGEVNCLLMEGSLHIQTGRFDRAIDQLDFALRRVRETGWRGGEPFILANLGGAYLEIGDYAKAEQMHWDALALCREMSDREGEAVSLDALGRIAQGQGDLTGAITYCQAALTLDSEIGYRRGEGYAATHLGLVLLETGDAAGAQVAFQRALDVHRALDPESGGAIDDLAGLAVAAMALGEESQAIAYAQEALSWLTANGVERVEYPVQVYLYCHRVLDTAGLPSDALAAAHALLNQQAARIDDARIRDSFLENVPFNREVLLLTAS